MLNLPIWLSTVIFGFGTVFVGLIALIWIVKLMSMIVRRVEDGQQGSREADSERNRTEAVIIAAVAAALNAGPDEFRVVSIRKKTGE